MTFRDSVAYFKAIVEAKGNVDIVETALLLRMVKPFCLKGIPEAKALEKLLLRVRLDGIVTADESQEILATLDRLSAPALNLAEYVRAIPDFPKPGVLFRDVTGILDTAEGFSLALEAIAEELDGVAFDIVAAPESRGFIFGAAIAARFGKAFAPIRKPGKLPRATVSESYDLEYGKATLHMHADAIVPGERVVVVDDLLATGGTALASARLVERLGGKVVKMIFPIELEGFEARTHALKDYSVASLVKYPGK